MGIALTDDGDTSADRLLADADAAMYQAKRAGKGCYRVFRADMHAAAVERMSLDQDLRSAIRDHALTVYYQPIIDAAPAAVVSFEALSRWRHPVRGYISPGTFIPVAEESGLIIELGTGGLDRGLPPDPAWHDRRVWGPLRASRSTPPGSSWPIPSSSTTSPRPWLRPRSTRAP